MTRIRAAGTHCACVRRSRGRLRRDATGASTDEDARSLARRWTSADARPRCFGLPIGAGRGSSRESGCARVSARRCRPESTRCAHVAPARRDGQPRWNPVDRMTRSLPRPWRIAIDWAVTIVGAIADRARDQGSGRQPVPDPVLVDGADAPLRAAGRRAARRASPTACSRTASSTTSAVPRAATSSSSRRRRRRRRSAARAARSSSG